MNRFFALVAVAPLFVLAACSASTGSPDGTDTTGEDLKAKHCGGIAGLPCADGYTCDFGANAHIPDATGTCKKDPAASTTHICGGIAGLSCPSGFSCQMSTPHHPDQSGACVKDAAVHMCGGLAGLSCPTGFDCQMPDAHVADQAGTCVKSAPSMCGGFAGLTCPSGFDCVMATPHHPDQSGTCVAK